MLRYQSILEHFEPLCPPATEADVRSAENALGVSLPESYREFLKHLNGGFPAVRQEPGVVYKQYFLFDVPQLEDIPLDLLSGIGTKHEWNDLVKRTLDAWYWNLTDDLVVIGNDPGGNRVVLGVKGRHFGKVFYWDCSYFFESSDDDGNIYWVSDDFAVFMEALKPWVSRWEVSGSACESPPL